VKTVTHPEVPSSALLDYITVWCWGSWTE